MHGLLLPVVERRLLESLHSKPPIFDLGCGNGSAAGWFAGRDWNVVGVDPSSSGIEHAKRDFPSCRLHVGSAYDDLRSRFGEFSGVYSLEVIEHVYAPREMMRTVWNLLSAGGVFVLSTPYHGYWKNLALAVAGKMDFHFTALWDHGHIKFWSVDTLNQLLSEQGFTVVSVDRLGRIPCLAKTMVMTARKG
jgi:2-polyprenyl-3-methyl-5-hydroxy-6-metoxy-1,4-benzoquinol methylase